MFSYDGPMLWMMPLIHDADLSPDSIIHQVDRAVADLNSLTDEELNLAHEQDLKVK